MNARFHLALDAFELDAAFRAPERGITCLLGRSGSGKTTLLRCVAGLESHARGHFHLGDRCWLDSERGRFVPPHRRPVGFVFQNANLFPHLSVRGNLRYAERRVPRSRERFPVDRAIAWLGLETLLERRPARLSGGEQQRVAIARALLRSPRLLLLDEPLASLDHAARRIILPYLERLHADLDIPILYVTHSMGEVARLADHVIWIDAGRVAAAGSPRDILGRFDLAEATHDDPLSVVDAKVRTHDTGDHISELDSALGPIYVNGLDHLLGSSVRVQIHARDVSIALEAEVHHSILNAFEMEIVRLEPAGPGQTLVYLALERNAPPTLVARITRRSAVRLDLEPGKRVWARVKALRVD